MAPSYNSHARSSATTKHLAPEQGSVASRQALLNYALDYPPTAQELEMRLLAECASSSTDDQQPTRRRNGNRLSKDDIERPSYQIILAHSRESLLSRLQRQPALRKSYMLARNGIRNRRTSGIPSLISDRTVSFAFPYRHSEQPSGRIHRRTTSLSEPTVRMRSIYASQARRYVSEPAIEKETANDNPEGFCVSANAINQDWELELIEGLTFEDLNLDLDLDHELDSSKTCATSEQATMCLTAPRKLIIEKLPVKQVLRAVRVEPDVVEIESPKFALEVRQINMPPTLNVVQAVAVTEQIFDDISPISDQDLDHSTDNEPVSPISIDFTQNELASLNSTEATRFIAFEAIPEIKLEANDWPLPRAELRESTSQSETLYSAELNAHPHLHPLRSNPTHPAIIHPKTQSTSSSASAAPTIHKKRSTSSLHSNRRAFVMQSNDSSLSLHSQDTVTDMSMNSSWLTPSTPTHSTPIRDNKRFSVILNLNLKRANAVRHAFPFHRR